MSKTPPKPDVPAQGGATMSRAGWRTIAAATALALAAVAAYYNSLTAPFVFDDVGAIVENQTIRHLWPPGEVLLPQHKSGLTVSGRPFVNLSFAVNYAISGTEVWSYHAFNLLFHILAGLTLFGLVRRTLQRPVLAGRFGGAAWPLGLAVAALWTLHPLQTESVTYVVQRAESLMGLFYLLTLYCFVRSVDSPRPRLWQAASLAACLLGVGCKEVIVTAPVVILLYDRTFEAGSFRAVWRQRRWFHAGLAATWLPLAWLVISNGADRGGAFVFTPAAFGNYWLVQFEAVTRYLQLSLWPQPLVFDYGFFKVEHIRDVAPYAPLVLGLVGATAWALWKKPVPGFLGAWFFGVLAPASLMPGTIQVIVEHRMYLSLAAAVVLVVAGLFLWLGRRCWLVYAALAVGCGGLTLHRNADYQSEFALWTDTLNKEPGNERAYVCVGNVYAEREQWSEALVLYEQALRFQGDDAEARGHTLSTIGDVYVKRGQWAQAVANYEQALKFQPDFAATHNNLATALMNEGRAAESVAHIEQALQFKPDYPEAELNWGTDLMFMNRFSEALPHFERAARLKPGFTIAELNWAIALMRSNRFPEAVLHFEKAVTLDPSSAEAHNVYGEALLRAGRFNEAVWQYSAALRIAPNYAEAHLNLSLALRRLGRMQEAAQHHREALRLNPKLAAGK